MCENCYYTVIGGLEVTAAEEAQGGGASLMRALGCSRMEAQHLPLQLCVSGTVTISPSAQFS